MTAAALVVEDRKDIARVASRLLEKRGWTVRVAASRDEALALLAGTSDTFCFAYVDIGLPDGDGLHVAAEARRLRPSMPIVLATGSIGDVPVADEVLLRKPFTLDQFNDAVDTALLNQSARDAHEAKHGRTGHREPETPPPDPPGGQSQT